MTCRVCGAFLCKKQTEIAVYVSHVLQYAVDQGRLIYIWLLRAWCGAGAKEQRHHSHLVISVKKRTRQVQEVGSNRATATTRRVKPSHPTPPCSSRQNRRKTKDLTTGRARTGVGVKKKKKKKTKSPTRSVSGGAQKKSIAVGYVVINIHHARATTETPSSSSRGQAAR